MSLEQLIIEATDDFLVACDWEKNFEICAKVTNDNDGNVFTTTVKRRIEKGSERTKSRAVELLQTGMQNSHWIVRAVHSPDFQKFLLDLVNGKSLNYDNKNKLLNLIRAWGEAFRPGNDHPGFPNFFRTYQFLEGSQRFPARDDDSNFMPPTAIESSGSRNRQPTPNQRPPPSSNASELEKVTYELEEKISQQELLKEVLQAIDPTVENVNGNDLVRELLGQCTTFQNRIRQVIERVSQDELLMRMLHYCDQLDDIQNKITTLMHAFSTRDTQKPPAAAAQAVSSSFGGLDAPVVLDIDVGSTRNRKKSFLSEVKPQAPVAQSNGNADTANADNEFDDMFDMLAMRHESKTKEEAPEQKNETSLLDMFSDLTTQTNPSNKDTNPSDLFNSSGSRPNPAQDIPDVFKDLL
uniref:VHS domain-containing protein n=1 Tax=Vannella robusta TaxID=1487602 RepID=A0A7S4IQZ9_9EUKA|mmetsp:Transcript_7116/g.8823  ORF Transcript_7116/g.8823 Transcript_7116/m.8823 type:complete len:409 (+) Transcript_7116:25-1251(+)